MMFRINFAAQVLSNPERRSEYDYERENPSSGFHSFGEYDFSGGTRTVGSKVMNMLLNVTRIQHTFNMLFKHQTKDFGNLRQINHTSEICRVELGTDDPENTGY